MQAERRSKKPISTFCAVSIYQNLPAGKCAKRFYDQLSHQFRDDFTFKHTMWNFAVLGITEARQEAIESFASADLIVLSFENMESSIIELAKWNDILDVLLELSAVNQPALATIYNREGTMEFADAAHAHLGEICQNVRGRIERGMPVRPAFRRGRV